MADQNTTSATDDPGSHTTERVAVTVAPCPHGSNHDRSLDARAWNEHHEHCVLWSTDDGPKWFQIVGFQRVEPPYRLTVRVPDQTDDGEWADALRHVNAPADMVDRARERHAAGAGQPTPKGRTDG